MAKTRKINNQNYTRRNSRIFNRKKDAIESAKRLRNTGYSARVVVTSTTRKFSGGKAKITGWNIYARQKSKSRIEKYR